MIEATKRVRLGKSVCLLRVALKPPEKSLLKRSEAPRLPTPCIVATSENWNTRTRDLLIGFKVTVILPLARCEKPIWVGATDIESPDIVSSRSDGRSPRSRHSMEGNHRYRHVSESVHLERLLEAKFEHSDFSAFCRSRRASDVPAFWQHAARVALKSCTARRVNQISATEESLAQ